MLRTYEGSRGAEPAWREVWGAELRSKPLLDQSFAKKMVTKSATIVQFCTNLIANQINCLFFRIFESVRRKRRLRPPVDSLFDFRQLHSRLVRQLVFLS